MAVVAAMNEEQSPSNGTHPNYDAAVRDAIALVVKLAEIHGVWIISPKTTANVVEEQRARAALDAARLDLLRLLGVEDE